MRRSALTDRDLPEPLDVDQREEWWCSGSPVNKSAAFKPWKRTRRKFCEFDDFLLWLIWNDEGRPRKAWLKMLISSELLPTPTLAGLFGFLCCFIPKCEWKRERERNAHQWLHNAHWEFQRENVPPDNRYVTSEKDKQGRVISLIVVVVCGICRRESCRMPAENPGKISCRSQDWEDYSSSRATSER